MKLPNFKFFGTLQKICLYGKRLFQDALEKYALLPVTCSRKTVLIASVFLSVYIAALFVCSSIPYCPLEILPVSVLVWLVVPRIFSYVGNIDFKSVTLQKKGLSSYTMSVIVFLLYILVLYRHGVARSADTTDQWRQVVTGNFNDWHPIVHTLSIYLFSRILLEDWFVVVCFIGIFSLMCGWLIDTLQRFQFRRSFVILTVCLLVFSPCSLSASRVLWKDSAFALAVLYLSIAMIHLWYSDGEWLLSWRHIVPTFGVLFYAAFVRHNGIFFVVPFLLFLPLLARTITIRRRLFLFSILAFVCFGGYIAGRMCLLKHGVIQNQCPGIVQPIKSQAFGESVGLPMSMLAQAFVENPKKVPQEAVAFLLKIAPYEKWKEYYTGDFNSVKFRAWPESIIVFNEIHCRDFFSVFFKTLIACPKPCITSFISVSSLGWDPFLYAGMDRWRYTLGLVLRMLGKIGIGWIFTAPGFYVFLLIFFGTYVFLKVGDRVLFMVTPFVAYTYGTSLLLSGFDHRFFWAIVIASPCVILTLMASGGKSGQQKTTECETCRKSSSSEPDRQD